MKNQIVLYYSWSGNTKKVADYIASKENCMALEINPFVPYSKDYQDVVEQVKKKVTSKSEILSQEIDIDMSLFDTVYIGSPIWWGTIAPHLTHFFKNVDWNGKTVMPFCTHGGGGKTNSEKEIITICHGADVRKMYEEHGNTLDKDAINKWIQTNLD